MKKLLLSLLIINICLLISTAEVSAAAFVITTDGRVERNVLGESTTITESAKKVAHEVAMTAVNGVAEIALTEIENRTHVKLEIPPKQESQELSENIKNLVLIEGDDRSQNIAVDRDSNGFHISQSGVSAQTDLTVIVLPETKEIFIETSSGREALSIAPHQVISTLVMSGAINILPSDGVRLVENNGALSYIITGERTVNFFNLGNATVPVVTTVSVQTGEIQQVDQPRWLSLFGFLFS